MAETFHCDVRHQIAEACRKANTGLFGDGPADDWYQLADAVMMSQEIVVVSRTDLTALIEDVEAIARLMQNMVYCRLMEKVQPLKAALDG